MLKIITVNAQGLRQKQRRLTAFNVLKRQRPDIILLQETHWTEELENEIRNDWGHEILFSNGTATARGTAMLFNPRLDYNIHKTMTDNNGRIICALIDLDEQYFNIVNLYAPNNNTERLKFYTELEQYISTEKNNIIAGDTNLALTDFDRMPGRPVARQSAKRVLQNLMTKYELIDIWRQRNPTKREFTWTGVDTSSNTRIRTRIDRILTNRTLDRNVSQIEIKPYQHSDHDATVITLDLQKQKRGAGYWHFNNALLNDEQFTNDINKLWTEWRKIEQYYESPLIWWDKVKRQFKQTAIEHSIKRRRRERRERSELEEKLTKLQQQANTTGNDEDLAKYFQAKNDLKQLDIRELEGVKIRAKAEYTEKGEKSTRYFFSLEKRRQAEQTIKLLTKDNNETATEQRDILKEVHSFYKSLYSAEQTDPNAQKQIFDIQTPTLTQDARQSCEGHITTLELQNALESMPLNKSPGLDGLTTNFYKHFWKILGTKMTDIYNYALEQGLLSVTQRRGVITLIFKKHDRTRLKNWRPITLLTTDYKILTKALANRLTNVLPQIIHPDQTACIKGRTINDNASLLRDAIHYANATNTKLAITTVDQLKAFDRVDHNFLFKTLEKFGFGPQFIKWIKMLYSSVSSCVKTNGWLTAFINLERGLRQGCPLSMPLYILTAEILATHIRANNQIRGLRLPNSNEETKLSQYADDTTFLLSDDNSIAEAFNTLDLYERASGAKINIEKCKGLWTGQYRDRTDQLLNFDWYNDYIPEKILGQYYGNIDCTVLNLEGKTQKFESIINAWTHRDLSYKGRALVINGLLTSVIWHIATTTHIPDDVIQDLERIIYKFFWNKKAPLLNRDILALPCSEGGFNIQRIKTKIQALRINTLKRLLLPGTSPWKKLTEFFLTVAKTKQSKMCLAQEYTLNQIDRDIPKYHKELLTAWSMYKNHLERTPLPHNIKDILNEPIFCNPDIKDQDGNVLLYKQWIKGRITRIKDMCYEAIPGFLPAIAIDEMIKDEIEDTNRTIQQTKEELETIINAIPRKYKRIINRNHNNNTEQTLQPSFNTKQNIAGQQPKAFTEQKTKDFYKQLLTDKKTMVPAMEHWRTNIQPTPILDYTIWQRTYCKLITNKQGDINWKIVHRILPTALSLNRMRCYHTRHCHRCNETETVEHVIVQCTQTNNFWKLIEQITNTITDRKLTLTDEIKLLGLTQQHLKALNVDQIQLINWTLTTARCALHKSVVDFRLRGENTTPHSLFIATANSHITLQFQIATQRNNLHEFVKQWCINEAIAKVENANLIMLIN